MSKTLKIYVVEIIENMLGIVSHKISDDKKNSELQDDESDNDLWDESAIAINFADLLTKATSNFGKNKWSNIVYAAKSSYNLTSLNYNNDKNPLSIEVASDCLGVAGDLWKLLSKYSQGDGVQKTQYISMGFTLMGTVLFAHSIGIESEIAGIGDGINNLCDGTDSAQESLIEQELENEPSTNDNTNMNTDNTIQLENPSDGEEAVPQITLSDLLDYIYDRTKDAITDWTKDNPPAWDDTTEPSPSDDDMGEYIDLSEIMPKLSIEDFLDYMTERAEASALQDGGGADGMDGQTGDGGNGDGGGADGGGGKWGDGNPPFAPDNPPPDQPSFSCQAAA